MVKFGRGLGLTLETLAALFIGAQMLRQELQGDLTVKLGVLGQVYLTHSASTNFFDDLVVRNLGTGSQGNKRPGPVIM
jgi:hypothetical protein